MVYIIFISMLWFDWLIQLVTNTVYFVDTKLSHKSGSLTYQVGFVYEKLVCWMWFLLVFIILFLEYIVLTKILYENEAENKDCTQKTKVSYTFLYCGKIFLFLNVYNCSNYFNLIMITCLCIQKIGIIIFYF